MDFVNIIIFLLIAVPIYKISILVYIRTRDYLKLSKLKGECNAKINYTRPPIFSLIKASSLPDLVIETDAEIYAVRFLSSGGRHRFMHLARRDFLVTYRRSYFALLEMFSFRRYKFKVTGSGSETASQRVKILPRLAVPKEISERAELLSKPLVKVIILSPEPLEFTYVTKEKTSIKLAFSGDEVDGYKVFNAKNFLAYADRQTRAVRNTVLN